LPKSFGIAFDGWTETGTHYVAAFSLHVNSSGSVVKHLLSMAPMLEEDDFSASTRQEYLQYVMQMHDRDEADIDFF